MNRKTLFSIIMAGFCHAGLFAQYATVPVTGFTDDVIANGVGSAAVSATTPVDKTTDNFALLSADFRETPGGTAPTYALPVNGLLTSAANSNVQFQLASYGSVNSLRLPAVNATGTLTFTTQRTASELYLCVTSASGSSTGRVDVNFADGTSQSFTSLTFYDWYDRNAFRVALGIGRVNRGSNQMQGSTEDPNLFQITLPLDTGNYGRMISSITVTRTGGGVDPVINVFAVSAKAVCTGPSAQPTSMILGTPTTSSLTGSFTAAAGNPSGYLIVRYPASSTVTPPSNWVTYTAGQALGNGVVVASQAGTGFIASGLQPGTTYNFYAYAYSAGADCGGPVYRHASPLAGTAATTGCASVAGIISVGPGGAFPTLTAALASLSGGISAPVILELNSTYTSAAETFPITISSNVCFTQTNTLTIRPASGATGRVISGNNAGPAIDFDGARYVTIDGTPGGSTPGAPAISVTASGSLHPTNLNILNTNNSGVAIRIDGSAAYNTVKYCDIQGQNNTGANVPVGQAGVIYFGNNGSTGNDRNVIERCNIHSTGISTPSIGIYSLGYNNGSGMASSYAPQFNDTNSIISCHIYDYFATSNSVGIELNYGNSRWLISGNSFFQTSDRVITNGYLRGIWLITNRGSSGQTGGSFHVLNNYIGGTAPVCGGGALTLPSGSGFFHGIRMELRDATVPQPATIVKGNVIRNISVTTSTGDDAFTGMAITDGNGSVIVDSNTIGSASGSGGAPTGGITIAASSGVPNHMMMTLGTYNFQVTRNVIGNILMTSPGTYFSGIFCNSAATLNVNNNTIGSLTEPNSIHASATSSSSGRYLNAIQIGSGNPILTITNNMIGGMRCDYATNGAQMVGINVASATANISGGITGNRIRGLVNASPNTGTLGGASVIGISVNSSSNAAGATVSGNRIDSLIVTSTATSSAINVIGIYYNGNTSTPATIARNFVHSFDVTSVNPSAVITGIHYNGGAATLVNNMVRLGIRPGGNALTTPLTINGILMAPATTNNIYFNSVYVGGTGVGTNANNTFAFRRTGSSGTYDVRNNIFVNNRGNATTGGKHFAVFLNSAVTGANLDYNIYQYTGTGGVFAYRGNADVSVYTPGWLSMDANSFPMDPRFVNPTGALAAVDLHINASVASPVEGNGIAIAQVTTDYDNETRSGLTPVDIGADAGNFTAIPVCVSPLAPTALVLTAAVPNQIDGSFTASAGGAEGYMVVRYPAGATPTHPAAGVGYTVGSSLGTGIIIASGSGLTFADPGLFANTAYDYYVYGYNRLCGGGVRYSPALSGSRLTQPCTGLSGVVTVGPSPAAYPTLSAALVAVNGGMSGSVILELQSGYVSSGETFPIVISNNACISPTATLTIRPAAGANGLLISGNNAGPSVDFNGARYVTIDGTPGGSAPGAPALSVTASGALHATNLNIVNTNNSGVAIRIDGNASYNTVKYCDIQGQNNAGANVPAGQAGVIYFGNNGSTGNDYNVIERCNIHSTGSSTPSIGIYSLGFNNTTGAATAYAPQFNDTNSIISCHVYDYFAASNSVGIELNFGNSRWLISGNSFFQTSDRVMNNSVYSRGIWMIPNRGSTGQTGGSFHILNNYIGGTAPFCGGSALTFPSGNAGVFQGVRLELRDATVPQPATVVKGNVIRNISVTTSTGSDAFTGMAITEGYGAVVVDSNTIGTASGSGGAATGGITIAASAGVPNHMMMTLGTYNFQVTRNVIGNILMTSGNTYFSGIFCNSAATLNVTNNTIGSLAEPNSIHASSTAAGSGDRYINAIQIGSGAPRLTISDNIIAGMSCDYTGAGAQVIGINVASTQADVSGGITGNRVKNLANASVKTNTNENSALVGIVVNSSGNTAGALVSGNRIDSLVSKSVSTTDAIQIIGLYYNGNATASGTISKNFVHSFDVTASNPNAVITGISYNGGAATVVNNMVRLGIRPDGAALTTPLNISGISCASTSLGNLYFNSVYIGGTGVEVTSSSNTYAFRRTNIGSSPAAYDVRNNIFSNVRSNTASGGGKHYAVSVADIAVPLTANYNLYQYTGVNGQFASVDGGVTAIPVYDNGTPWITGDVNSRIGDPQFVNPIGSLATVSLHISTTAGTPVEGTGVLISAITEDIDGQVRSTLTPTDMGADAGNFVLPNVTISGITTVCAGGTLALTAASSLPNPSFSWTGPNSFNANTQSISISPVAAAAAGSYIVSVVSGGNTYTATANVVITPLPVISSVVNNGPLCVGAQLDLSATVSATGTIAYQWSGPGGFSANQASPTRSNVQTTHAGTYTVSATSNGCSANSTTQVVVSANPVITGVTSNTPVCAGGTLDLSVTATAASPLTYQWTGPGGFSATGQTPSRSNMTLTGAGNYTVVATANNCIATGNVIVSVTSLPVIAAISNNGPLCEGSQLDLFGVSTTAGATYSWTGPNGFSAAMQNPFRSNVALGHAGAYVLSVTANNCIRTDTTHVIINPLPEINSVTNSGPVCAGSDVGLFADVATQGTRFLWSGPNGFSSTLQNPVRNNVNTLHDGIYTVRVTSGACAATGNTTVEVHPLPEPDLIYHNFTLTTDANYISYTWYRNGVLIPGATGNILSVTDNGVYSVLVTDASGCSNMSPAYNINNVSVKNIVSSEGIRVYPNPTRSVVYVEVQEDVLISVHAVDGKELLRRSDTRSIDLEPLPDGVYMLRIYGKGGLLMGVQRIVKQ